jgi:hypothetical protein
MCGLHSSASLITVRLGTRTKQHYRTFCIIYAIMGSAFITFHRNNLKVPHYYHVCNCWHTKVMHLNTLRTGDADLRLYITTVQDGWRKSAFLTSVWFPARSRVLDVITQYMAPVSEWSRWRLFIETWPHSQLMICDKYREQTALYLPLSLRSV